MHPKCVPCTKITPLRYTRSALSVDHFDSVVLNPSKGRFLFHGQKRWHHSRVWILIAKSALTIDEIRLGNPNNTFKVYATFTVENQTKVNSIRQVAAVCYAIHESIHENIIRQMAAQLVLLHFQMERQTGDFDTRQAAEYKLWSCRSIFM